MSTALPTASILDTGRVLRDVLLPVVARAAILPRPRLTQLAEILKVDDRALGCMRHLRDRHGTVRCSSGFPDERSRS
jgi:hypothetical protein